MLIFYYLIPCPTWNKLSRPNWAVIHDRRYMATFTANEAFDELVEDVNKATLAELVKELIVHAATEAREEMREDLPAQMAHEMDLDGLLGASHKKMLWYLAGVNVIISVSKFADNDSKYASVVREARVWVNAWAERYR